MSSQAASTTPDDLAESDALAEPDDLAETTDEDDETADHGAQFSWGRLVVTTLPLILALGVGYMKWLDGTARESQAAAEQTIRAASESAVAILSYRPETVDQDAKTAADRLTGDFRQQYVQLVHDVVAPGAKQQHILAEATVPAAASVSTSGKQAVVLVFVDQTTTIGDDAPSQSTSSVRVTLNRVDGRWLVSQFDPV